MKNMFWRNVYNVVNNNFGGGQGGGLDIHSITILFYVLNIVHGNDFLDKNLKIILVPSSNYCLLSQFHYPSLLNDIQV
jgi:hypothetical protein